jgi:hypothetical protein
MIIIIIIIITILVLTFHSKCKLGFHCKVVNYFFDKSLKVN